MWNTLRIAEIVEAVEAASSQPVAREDLARVSPLLSARLLVSGRHNFDRATSPGTLTIPMVSNPYRNFSQPGRRRPLERAGGSITSELSGDAVDVVDHASQAFRERNGDKE